MVFITDFNLAALLYLRRFDKKIIAWEFNGKNVNLCT